MEKGSYERSKLLWSLNPLVNANVNLAIRGFHLM